MNKAIGARRFRKRKLSEAANPKPVGEAEQRDGDEDVRPSPREPFQYGHASILIGPTPRIGCGWKDVPSNRSPKKFGWLRRRKIRKSGLLCRSILFCDNRAAALTELVPHNI
jgi:hypothetical protein